MNFDVPDELKIQNYTTSIIEAIASNPMDTLTRAELELLSEYKSELFKQKNLLLSRLFQLIELYATQRQKIVIALLLRGMTYSNIAQVLSLNYSTVAGCITGCHSGARDYTRGGLRRKFRNICKEDQECRIILKEIKRINAKINSLLV